jgi:Trk K+ transport system NAD-binding subunit
VRRAPSWDSLLANGLVPRMAYERLRSEYQIIIAEAEREIRRIQERNLAQGARLLLAVRRRLIDAERAALSAAERTGLIDPEVAERHLLRLDERTLGLDRLLHDTRETEHPPGPGERPMRILIAGGGRVGGVLAAKLVGEQHQVTVVERDRAVCDRLFEEVERWWCAATRWIPRSSSRRNRGSGRRCAVLPRDADNLAFAMLVRARRRARTMVRMLDPSYRQAYLLAGVRDIIAEAEVVVAKMATAIDFPQIAGSLPLAAGDAVLFELVIKPRAMVAGRTVAQVRGDPEFPKECVFIGFLDADGKIALPDGATALRPGHTAILVTRRSGLGQAVEVLTPRAGGPGSCQAAGGRARAVDFLAPLDDAEIERIAQGIVVRTRARG